MLLLGLVLAVPASAQIDMPPLSPEGYVKQKVGYVTVEVTYSRPSMRGRAIFGDVVPFNEVWRTGANASTKIKFSQEVTLNEHKVPAGEYALYTIPAENEWTIILSKNTKLWGAYGYKEADDLVRFKVKPEKTMYHFETFTIDIGELTGTSATLQLLWENTVVRINLGTTTDEEIVAKLDKLLNNPMVQVGNNYYGGADYYLRTHRDMDQALTWINKAIEINGASPWYLQTKAEIMVEKGDYGEAIKIANEGVDIAKSQGDDAHVMALETMIAKWKDVRSKN
jgi:tetratricopeptide (TPR) repeat protein